MTTSFSESDEVFARRLQAQEMGALPIPDAQTPLMNRNNNHENPTIINARLNDINSARINIGFQFLVNTPQVLACVIILSMHWNDTVVCDNLHMVKWKVWSTVSALRMVIYTLFILFCHTFKTWLDERPLYMQKMNSIKNAIDAFALVWFVVGNMWLLGEDDDGGHCSHPEKSPLYKLCLSILIINYVQICLPCIIAILLIPVFCFCMPCLIRVMARMQAPRTFVGASDALLESLPEVVVSESDLNPGEDHTCPICLNEMAVGDVARALNCNHMFHKQCVDEWLRVNASCPTCRKRIVNDALSEAEYGSAPQSTTNLLGSTEQGGGDIALNTLHRSNTPV